MIHLAMTVSELTALLKGDIEEKYRAVEVEGEISNLHHASSGHYYFTLKDEQATIQAALFRGTARYVTCELRDGLLVKARGAITIYAKRGAYQIVCAAIERVRFGDILAMLEERKRRLAAAGLFAAERKRPVPAYARRVALITSPTGAAVRDFVRGIERRNGMIDIVVLPVAVQGERVVDEVCAQLAYANRHQLADVAVLTRGGGSVEDLLPFSDEQVVRAVAESHMPVVAAIGHEIDVALCELAADARASTPSVAAELIAVDSATVRDRAHDLARAMGYIVKEKIKFARMTLGHNDRAQLSRYMKNIIEENIVAIDDMRQRMHGDFIQIVREKHAVVQRLRGEITALSPRAVLERGYAIVFGADNRHISDGAQVTEHEDIAIQFHNSRLRAVAGAHEGGAPHE